MDVERGQREDISRRMLRLELERRNSRFVDEVKGHELVGVRRGCRGQG